MLLRAGAKGHMINILVRRLTSDVHDFQVAK
jgi:hypothetical protein